MYKKITVVLFGFIFLFIGTKFAYAGVVINEVQLKPTEGRFIELYNTNDGAVDLTGWYMQRKTSTGSSFGSLVSNPNFEGKTIGAHGYFVISKNSLNNSDLVLDSLTLTESNTIQIKNSNQDVVDKIGWGDGCDGSCISNPNDGDSIQRDENGSLIIGTPTPGAQNSNNSYTSSTDSTSSSISDTGSSTQNKTQPKSKVTEVPTMKVKILANASAFTGQPIEMKANILGYSNENVVLGRAYWNFGDGGSLEQINNFEKFYHTYYYSGDYVVFLEYYKDSFSKTPEATSKMIIKVIPTTVTISKVGDMKDFFVELSNNASSDIDISNWVISASGKTFVLPKNSVILSKKSMIISDRITRFSYGDQYNLKLFSSTGEIVSDYSASNFHAQNTNKGTVQSKIPANQNQTNLETLKPLEEVSAQDLQVPAENLEASVVSSDPIKSSSLRIYFLAMILTIFIGVSAGAVYLIRQKKSVTKAGEDFDILDE